ncbi:hypothetical protein DITRI_Ditri15bG0113800 [Diplodiscus trichospermus]
MSNFGAKIEAREDPLKERGPVRRKIAGEMSNFGSGIEAMEDPLKESGRVMRRIAGKKSNFGAIIEARDDSFNCIFGNPFSRLGFNKPELVSIGPYHWGKNLPLDKYKYSILEQYLSRTKNQGKDICFFVPHMISLEPRARRCYSVDFGSMSNSEFVEIMLVDACFIIEVLRHFGRSEELVDGSSFFLIEPWQIPILVRDLLLLENQIPFFILDKLFALSESEEGKSTVSLITMALKFFDLAYPLSLDFISKFNHLEPKHLLDLILHTVGPSNPSTNSLFSYLRTFNFFNSVHSRIADGMLSLHSKPSTSESRAKQKKVHPLLRAGELRKLGIEFKPRRADSFTDIHFKDGMLEIPPVTINDLFMAILVNCVALEYRSKYTGCSNDLTAYAFWMSCLITDPTDVECLCSNGIISTFSYDSNQVASACKYLRLCISTIKLDNIQDSYLYETVMEVERYYSGSAITRRCYIVRDPRTLLFCITTLCFTCHIFNLGSNVLIRWVNWPAFHGPAGYLLPSISILMGFYVIFGYRSSEKVRRDWYKAPVSCTGPERLSALLLVLSSCQHSQPSSSCGIQSSRSAKRKMGIKFLDWYLKIAVGAALIGGSMELFMIKTGFYDKVTVLESEKRAWDSSPEAQAIREALNPWRNHDARERKNS